MTKRTSAAAKALFALALLAAGLVAPAPAAWAAEKTVVLSVPEMECGSKEVQADMALTGLDGIKGVKLDTDERTAVVTFDDETVDVEAMKEALGEFDMSATVAGEKAPPAPRGEE